MTFRTSFAENIFRAKYALMVGDTWPALAGRVVYDVCHGLMRREECDRLVQYITDMKFIPAGRYLRYAGRNRHFWNNCFCLRAEHDTREEWGEVVWRSLACLMTGGGIGIDYSVIRPDKTPLSSGGECSGPMSLMRMVNEAGREVMQGGARRSAIYASLNWRHPDAGDFIHAKDWSDDIRAMKDKNFGFPAPLDMTNISLNYDDAFLEAAAIETPYRWLEAVYQMMKTGEPGCSFNFGEWENETLRNAPIAGDTQVLTKHKGYRPVKHLAGDGRSIVWTGKQWVDTVFKRTAKNADIIKVGMTGRRTIKAEPSHPFMVERWHGAGKRRKLTGIVRVPAVDLKVGDVLHASLPDFKKYKFNSFAYTIGFAYGDGYFGTMYTNGEIALCSEEKIKLLKYFDKDLFTSVSPNMGPKKITRCYIRSGHTALRSKDKYPTMIDQWMCSFIAGLFDSDGSYDAKHNYVRLSSIHLGFLQDTRRALEQIGILSGIHIGSKGAYKGTPTYMLCIMSEYISKFAEMIPTKRLKVKDHTSYRSSKIKVLSIEPGEREDVYCCNVGVPEHTFMAEGVIISNCCEITSEDDSDVCNLGSVNMSRIESCQEFADVCRLGSQFLVCGSIGAELPYQKVIDVRAKNRRIGLGLMGIHEWLLKNGGGYEVTPQLKSYLETWKETSEDSANEMSDRLSINRPVKYRAIAPTGTIGIIASTTTGIEPVFATAYKRRYMAPDTSWRHEYVVDATADYLINQHGLDPEKIETAYSLAEDPEKRIKFQYDVQKYVDHAISSTINIPAWNTTGNNDGTVEDFADMLLKYAPGLRGMTVYPDGARGGQPITEVPYKFALDKRGVVFDETEEKCISGLCGV